MATVDNFYVRDRQLVLPGSFQRSSYMSEVLEDIANGFVYIDSKSSISSGTSSTLTSTSNRNVFFTGSSLTYTLTLPTAPTDVRPPIRIYNCGVSNVITISGGASKIMSGATAGQITLTCPGDFIELQYMDATIGWAIIAMRSNRIVTIAGSGNVQLNRFQNTFIDARGNYSVALLPPTDAQVGEVVSFSLAYDYDATDAITFDGVSIIDPVGVGGFIQATVWKTGSGWVIGRYT